ncbi:hypothetical protein LTR66_007577 [Elasticomyces elasticus]|nr:hypothetical protein LTR66_007577 [Elasticomyces elasticus]KAK5008970.1 hypothetical protein LTR28_003256 [Elasticomyces elasticus]
MSLSLYDITIPVFIRGLNNLSAVLKKAEKYADEKGMPHSKLLEARLAPDMAALPFQIQTCSNTSKGAAVRVGGVEPTSMDDNESTFEELQTRIRKTIEILQGVDRKVFEGKEEKEVVLRAGGAEYKFTGKSFMLDYALPNFFFHDTAAYAILRHMGVPLGKLDYMGFKEDKA